jgi:hypothetical protein
VGNTPLITKQGCRKVRVGAGNFEGSEETPPIDEIFCDHKHFLTEKVRVNSAKSVISIRLFSCFGVLLD